MYFLQSVNDRTSLKAFCYHAYDLSQNLESLEQIWIQYRMNMVYIPDLFIPSIWLYLSTPCAFSFPPHREPYDCSSMYNVTHRDAVRLWLFGNTLLALAL